LDCRNYFVGDSRSEGSRQEVVSVHGRMFRKLRRQDFFDAACDGDLMREIEQSVSASKGTTSLVLAAVDSASDRDV
jgi:hypothetical protein